MIETLKEVRDALKNSQYDDSLRNYEMQSTAITKLDALIAQRAAGDDGLAQQYAKLSAHCAMLEDKLATLTNAIGAKQMADFVAKHVAQEKAEPVVRYCPDCGLIGDVPATARDCCPDGMHARMVPVNFAKSCQDTFMRAIAPQPAPSTSQPLTDFDISAAIEVADAKWADADAPMGWVMHFARALEAKIGAKP